MRWTVVLAACGVLMGCGNVEAPGLAQPTPTPTPALQFAEPPLIVVSEGNGTEVWFRLNRPLADNEGSLGEHANYAASIEIQGTTPDIPLLSRDDLHPTCYNQFLDGELQAGVDVDLTLDLGPAERLTTTARTEEAEPAGTDPLRRLRCPSDHGATRRCHGDVQARHVAGIDVRSATNTSCATARAVMRSAGRWADSSRCYERLCASAHRINRGYRCSAELVGEAAWQITCTRGNRTVRGYTAD